MGAIARLRFLASPGRRSVRQECGRSKRGRGNAPTRIGLARTVVETGIICLCRIIFSCFPRSDAGRALGGIRRLPPAIFAQVPSGFRRFRFRLEPFISVEVDFVLLSLYLPVRRDYWNGASLRVRICGSKSLDFASPATHRNTGSPSLAQRTFC